jgi:hypothetical protein
MKTQLTLVPTVTIPPEILRAAGFAIGQTIAASVKPGEIRFKLEPAKGRIVRRGKFKVLTGTDVASVDIAQAIRWSRGEF